MITAQYHLQWNPPNNMAEFDLDHYELIVGAGDHAYEINVYSSENDAIVSVGVGNLSSVNLSAVDRCGQKGESIFTSLDARLVLARGLSTEVGCEPSTASSGISTSTVILSVFTAILSIAVVMLVIVCVSLTYNNQILKNRHYVS